MPPTSALSVLCDNSLNGLPLLDLLYHGDLLPQFHLWSNSPDGELVRKKILAAKKQKNEEQQRLNGWMPRRIEKKDTVEWHLLGDEWLRPENLQLSLDVASRRLELRAHREVNGVMMAGAEVTADGGAKNDKQKKKDDDKDNENGKETFSTIREIRQSFTLPEDVDLERLQSTWQPDRCTLILSAPRKLPRVEKDDESSPVPIKIIRK